MGEGEHVKENLYFRQMAWKLPHEIRTVSQCKDFAFPLQSCCWNDVSVHLANGFDGVIDHVVNDRFGRENVIHCAGNLR